MYPVLRELIITNARVKFYGYDLSWNNAPLFVATPGVTYHLVAVVNPGGGHCFFHALLLGFHKTYRECDEASAVKMVINWRQQLAQTLATPVVGESRYYDLILGGMAEKFVREGVEEYSLANMQAVLNSSKSLGYGFIEFMTMVCDKDIYILSGKTGDIYMSDELPYSITGRRTSLVLLYIGDCHYELLCVQRSTGELITHFKPESRLIRTLHARVQTLLAAIKP